MDAIITLYIWIGGRQVNTSEKLKDIRRKSLMNQSSFAKELGVSFSTVNRWENGKAIPSYQALNKIKEYCDKKGFNFEIDFAIWEDKK